MGPRLAERSIFASGHVPGLHMEPNAATIQLVLQPPGARMDIRPVIQKSSEIPHLHMGSLLWHSWGMCAQEETEHYGATFYDCTMNHPYL